VAGRNTIRTRQSKNYFCGKKEFCFAPTDFFKTVGILYPSRRRVREECAADSLVGFKKALFRAMMELL